LAISPFNIQKSTFVLKFMGTFFANDAPINDPCSTLLTFHAIKADNRARDPASKAIIRANK
jgi:hypothetical protein